jgi:hypothetical protein
MKTGTISTVVMAVYLAALAIGCWWATSSARQRPASDDSFARSQKWGAESDALDLILRERQEPSDLITCYWRASRFECPLHTVGQPTRWAACRPRREGEHRDDGGRCAWIAR